MKKFFKIILTALAALCFAFPLAACNDGGIKKGRHSRHCRERFSAR